MHERLVSLTPDSMTRYVSLVCMPGTSYRPVSEGERTLWQQAAPLLTINRGALSGAHRIITPDTESARALALDLTQRKPLPIHNGWHTIGRRDRIKFQELELLLLDVASFLEQQQSGNRHAAVLISPAVIRRVDQKLQHELQPLSVVQYRVYEGKLCGRQHFPFTNAVPT